MKRLPLLILSVGLLAACSTGQAGNLGKVPTGPALPPGSSSPAASQPASTAQPSNGSSAPAPPSSPAPTVTVTATSPTTGTAAQVGLQTWFTRQGTQQPELFVTERTVPATSSIGTAALDSLLAGPTAAENSAGLRSQIPAGTQLLGLRIGSGTATVNLSPSFTSGDSSTMPLRIAQVVYTLTQFPTVTGVLFEINGQGVTVLGGVPVQAPQTAAMYVDKLPAITVQNPAIGEQVTSPVTVSGTANVFEAVVSVRILDSAGHEIARTFSTASCGTGCRGGYSVPLSYSVTEAEPGTVEVFETSPKDGQPVDVQLIPVTLTP
jgi:hypothetical protein